MVGLKRARNAGVANTCVPYNVVLTVASTQYSQALPTTTIGIEFQNRSNNDLLYAFTTGKVAPTTGPGVPTAPYFTVKAGQNEYKDLTFLKDKTIYFASANAGDVVELFVWRLL